MSTVIKVESLSKQYRLGNVGLGSLGADVNRWWHTKVLGNEDPYLKIGEENNREVADTSGYVWALRDINFEVQQGEVLGIIGRNGAGKSTLLKILSRVTGPTTGSIKIQGRVASLLEVGTGFHPELTGRENIFLNGAILGMTKQEIRSKFNEIVSFAGVERYVDTPVKRYSSGMYVRLAFAVAAHLEPEILIVDEVLAVGDAEFQKKAIGKMKEVSEGQGRTVLFVSHNMESIASLTNNCILLKEGRIAFIGETRDAIKKYLDENRSRKGIFDEEIKGNKPQIIRAEVQTSEGGNIHKNGEDLIILVDVNMPALIPNMNLSIQIFNSRERAIIYTYAFDVDKPLLRNTGVRRYKFTLPKCKLYQDEYYLKLHLAESKSRVKFQTIDKVCAFEVKMIDRMIEWGWPRDVCSYTEEFFWEEVSK